MSQSDEARDSDRRLLAVAAETRAAGADSLSDASEIPFGWTGGSTPRAVDGGASQGGSEIILGLQDKTANSNSRNDK